MELTFSCPTCGVLLRAPQNASGKKMRCPACRQISQVPDLSDKLGETISGWMLDDVENELQARHRKAEQTLEEANRRAEEARQAKEKERQRPRPTPKPGPMKPGEPASRNRRVYVSPSASAKSGETVHGEVSVEFPDELLLAGPRPHLVVRKVGTYGVRFAFDARWLKNKRFRASMPVRCAVTGDRDPAKLIARPIVFKDLVRGQTIESVRKAHEVRGVAGKSPRSIVKRMGVLEHMRSPYNQPLAWYVVTHQSKVDLFAETIRRPEDDGVTCEFVIPNGDVALSWLSRVNGVCGVEYELLQKQIGKDHGDEWNNLPEAVRARVQVWCEFTPQETCLGFFPDAEFGKADQGLAGLVITERRLVYQKYHHRGAFDLGDEDAKLVVKPDGLQAQLWLNAAGQRHKLVRIRRDETQRLVGLLERHARYQIDLANESLMT